MALNSQLDKDGAVNKGKDSSQYGNLNPSAKGGEIGTKTSTSKDMKEVKIGKFFAGKE